MGWHSVSVLQVGRGQASTREAAEGRHIRVTGTAALKGLSVCVHLKGHVKKSLTLFNKF